MFYSYSFFLQISRYTLQLPDAMQSWSHILTMDVKIKVNGSVWVRGPVITENSSGKKLTMKCEPTPQKGSGEAGKVCGCREEGELSSSLATNYWTNYLPVKILFTQLQGWENTLGGGSEPEVSELLHWHEGGWLPEDCLIQSSCPKQGQLQAGKHGSTTASLDNLCQCLTILSVLYFLVELHVFQFGLLSCCGHHWEGPGSLLFLLSIRYLYTLKRSFRSFYRLHSPS